MKVVVWSGGIDSTLILAHELAHDAGNVKAITLTHPQLPQEQLVCERRVRAEFKQWARTRGWSFRHEMVRVRTNGTVHHDVGQSGMWLCHLMPYLQAGDTALFGYIREDDFWHGRHLFVAAFGAIVSSHYAGGKILVQFPLEWHRKRDVVDGARRFRIPRRVWWTCDSPIEFPLAGLGFRRCGRCSKCREIKRAREDLRKLGTSSGVTSLRPPSKQPPLEAKAQNCYRAARQTQLMG